jgi:cytochrome c peroxidase
MWDGRETVQPLTDGKTLAANLRAGLLHQAMDATLGHAQAAVSPTASQLNAIVDFELALFTGQQTDNAAGGLQTQQGTGGPVKLASAPYFPGINDPLGDNPTGADFDPAAFTLFQAWKALGNSGRYASARKAVARGEEVFNTHALKITGVAGLNDALGVATINGTCTTCHDSPNVGHHSRPLPLDIGTSHVTTFETDPQVIAALTRLSAPDLPVFKVECQTGPRAGTVQYTSDPGRALISGKCADIGRLKGPILRGLTARAPFFHNGAAATLRQVVEFYNLRFQMGLTDQEKADLEAFLRAL